MNVSLRLKPIILGVATAIMFTAAGVAGTLPDPSISGGVFNDITGDFKLCSASCAFEGGSFSVSSSPVLISMFAGAGHSASGSYSYDVLITGPADGTLVPYYVQGFVSADAAGDSVHGYVDTAGANFEVGGTRVTVNFNDISGGSLRICGASCIDSTASGWSGTLGLMGFSGTTVTVSLSVSGSAQDGFASAAADPHIYIDPDFLAANPGYSLVFPDGVGNELASTATPEPSSLLLAAVALVGSIVVRRKASYQ